MAEVTVSYNEVIIRGKNISDLISEMYEEGTQKENYYRDIVDIAFQMHESLKRSSCCSCLSSRKGNRSNDACFVVTKDLINTRRRGKYVVVPGESLFEEEDAKDIFQNIKGDKKKKKKRKRYLDIEERNICLLALYEDECGNTVFLHSKDIFSISSMKEGRFIICPYSDSVAKEIWMDPENRLKREMTQDEENTLSEIHWTEDDLNASNTHSKDIWIGVDIYSIWPELESYIPCDSLIYSSYTGYSTKKGKNTSRKDSENIIQSQSIQSLNILRDSIVFNALGIKDLMKIRKKKIPSECIKVLTNTSHKEDTDLQYSIVFFEKASEAQKYARKNGFYMGAHDINAESGAKRFFVTTTCFGAYENIRLMECESPPPLMYEQGWDKKLKFSHECLLPERNTKLYIDVDIKVEEAIHFLPYEKNKGAFCFTWMIVDRITLSVICWFNEFIKRIFDIDVSLEDWTVLCATDLKRKMSRHFILSKEGCFFRSKLDLMMFMDIAQYVMNKDIVMRERSKDFSFWDSSFKIEKKVANVSPISWMTKMETQMDPVSKVEIKSERPIVDFSVYSEFSFMRGSYCSKMSDPGRVLNILRIDTSLIKGIKNPMEKVGDEGVLFILEDSNKTFPLNNQDIEKDFQLWKRSSIQCVSPESEEGLALPLSIMFPNVKNSKVTKETIAKYSKEIVKGDDSNDGFHQKNIILSFTDECWWKTSTVPNGKCRETLESIISSMLNNKSVISGISGGGSLRSWAYSAERIQYGKDKKSCPYNMLREYFAQVNPPQVEKIIDIKEWSKCDKIVLTKKIDKRSEEEKEAIEKTRNLQYISSLPENKRRRYEKKNIKTDFYSKSTKKESTPSHERKNVKSKNDHVVVNIKGSKWCPIGMKDHKSCGKVYLKIYRNGDVACRCFSENCQMIASNHGQGSTYRKLYPLNEEQKRILWGDDNSM